MITLKPHQQAFVDRNPQKAILAWGVRVGKTYTIAMWAQKRSETDFLLACPKRIKQNWIQDLVLCGTTNVTVVTKEEFKDTDLSKYNGVIVDECFIKGTKLHGGKKIEDVKIGDVVRNAIGYGVVTNIFSSKSNIVVTINGSIKCTPNHPFLTQRGWVNAIDLQNDDLMLHFDYDKIMRNVWRADKEKRWKEILQRDMLYEISREKRNGQKKNDIEKSDENQEKCSKDEGYTKINWPQTKNPWWKWANIANPTKNLVCSIGGWLGYGVCCKNKGYVFEIKESPHSLQNRRGESNIEDSNRGGRLITSGTCQEITGYKEGQVPNTTRVESITIQKRKNTEFFNLSVSGHPSYILESGEVVHNCHHFASGLFEKTKKVGNTNKRKYAPSQLTATLYNWLREHPEYPVLLATATPIASKPSNLHTLAALTGTYWDWKQFREYFYELVRRPYAPFPFWVPKETWRELIKPYAQKVCDIVLLSDVMDVPEQKHEVVKVVLEAATKKAIKEAADLSPSKEWFMKHQLAQGKEKLNKIMELSEGEAKVIVVCKYTAQIEYLAKELNKHREVFVLDGHTKDPHDVIQKAGESLENFFLMQADCAEGFRGDSYSMMIFASMSWKTVSYQQALGRMLHLDKQDGNIFYYLIAEEKDHDIYQRVVIDGEQYSLAGIKDTEE